MERVCLWFTRAVLMFGAATAGSEEVLLPDTQPQAVLSHDAPTEPPAPGVVLSTHELITRYNVDVPTAIAIHELLREQDGKQASLRAEPDVRRRLTRTQSWLAETEARLAGQVAGWQLEMIRRQVRNRHRAQEYWRERTAGGPPSSDSESATGTSSE